MFKKVIIIFLTILTITPTYSVFAEEEQNDDVMNAITENLALLRESSPLEINLDDITPDNPFIYEKTVVLSDGETIKSTLIIEDVTDYGIMPLTVFDEGSINTTIELNKTYRFSKTYDAGFNSKVTHDVLLTKTSSTSLRITSASIAGVPAQAFSYLEKDVVESQPYDWEVRSYGYYSMRSIADAVTYNVYVDFRAAISLTSNVLAIEYECYS